MDRIWWLFDAMPCGESARTHNFKNPHTPAYAENIGVNLCIWPVEILTLQTAKRTLPKNPTNQFNLLVDWLDRFGGAEQDTNRVILNCLEHRNANV